VRSGGPALNETLCRALLQARITEEDVATRLQVDPKTVRRWLEGRVPYLRHRWAIAAMLGADETDLWPQLRAARTRPDEVVAIYPHRDTVPRDVWLRVLCSAEHEIGLLADVGLLAVRDHRIMAALAERAGSGVRIRICLYDTSAARNVVWPDKTEAPTATMSHALNVYAPLRDTGRVQLRLYQGMAYSSIYYGDGELLVSQLAYGLPPGRAPVLHLRRLESDDVGAAYLDAFEHTWAAARSAE
jgi:transcriptional regulator with XRE-family HTH domain